MWMMIAAALALQPDAAEPEPVAAPPGDALFAAMGEDAAAHVRRCGVDTDEVNRLIGLDPWAFDQDREGGWRVVARREGCEPAGAALIETYLHFAPQLDAQSFSILRWHAGQMHASSGETEAAIAWFSAAKKPGDDAWNLYADATIAFLEEDRDAAETARAALAALAPGEAEQAARRQAIADNPHITFPDGFVTQPMNLNVVDKLLACWGQPYTQAYGTCDTDAEN